MSTPNKLNSRQVKEIRIRVARGERPSDIAPHYGVKPQTISYHTKDIPKRVARFARKVPPRIDEAKVLYLYALGHSQSEIARQVGADPSTICKALTRMEQRAAA